VVIYPSSGTGAWEAALVNTLSTGDSVLMFEVGQFATLWCDLARRFGLNVRFVQGDWRSGPAASEVERILTEDTGHSIKAVGVVHNETSTVNLINFPLDGDRLVGVVFSAEGMMRPQQVCAGKSENKRE
jgi:aspartate aminotransferase-like enzyme